MYVCEKCEVQSRCWCTFYEIRQQALSFVIEPTVREFEHWHPARVGVSNYTLVRAHVGSWEVGAVVTWVGVNWECARQHAAWVRCEFVCFLSVAVTVTAFCLVLFCFCGCSSVFVCVSGKSLRKIRLRGNFRQTKRKYAKTTARRNGGRIYCCNNNRLKEPYSQSAQRKMPLEKKNYFQKLLSAFIVTSATWRMLLVLQQWDTL